MYLNSRSIIDKGENVPFPMMIYKEGKKTEMINNCVAVSIEKNIYIYMAIRSNVCGFTPVSTLFPFPKQQILVSSKLKEFADDNSKFGENGRKFPKQVENTAGKGEIARYEQFLLFPQCFQKPSTADT